ncbi:uncharacterized protein PGTG_05230 [Puccinia graminis f. sp. tritici CRL 75-36-700-3]|uniref:DUF6589 domain-containing protein n=1 Tax=Puccinia graminis f. sp. tritici (strain CRL 75-36-700-3 / race SCCL) TaxID=418459 RepID=E3K6H6_PUCGT|nr:uncharacterized protein PGTG_05230 [Puccinia graminis f. sp. tritici CRL 75-36-700-3]EFP80005.1 hypothetical protein PGTG_05230 [Puccinia graminis f. sp. tritici CRL 75-36-700-3]
MLVRILEFERPNVNDHPIRSRHLSGSAMNSTEETTPAGRAPRVSMNEKLDKICALIEELNLTPKSFLVAFLEQDQYSMAYRRRLWGTDQGWDSTENLLLTIRKLACSHLDGRGHWERFILMQAIDIVSAQKPVSGLAPKGSYHTSATLSDVFFTTEEREARNDLLTDRMPFLYQLLCAKIQGDRPYTTTGGAADSPADPVEDNSDDEGVDDPSDGLVDYDGSVLKKSNDRGIRRANRVKTMARTICAMVAFGGNRRHNGFQLSNALLFLAGGVTERVSAYLNYIGISSSRRTAHAALRSLGSEAKSKLEAIYKMGDSPLVAPLLCYDNLDFQEKVHMKSIGHSSKMFHGTWGYVHTIPRSLQSHLDPAELTVEALNKALHIGKDLKIRPDMFTPTAESTIHFETTIKSQITRVILKYFATPTDKRVDLLVKPLEVNPIAPDDPNITMLKLMVASDNSALGVGEVFTGVIQQSGLTPAEFHSRLQIVEGDLGSCNIFDSLRKQRTPALGNHNSLDNILPIPGAAHTLWNLSQAIYLAHWGNEKLARDTGAWRTLHALGIPAEKPVTKKDFNLMLCHIEKIHEATLLYCVLLVANRAHEPWSGKRLKVSTESIHDWVELTFDRFCSGAALQTELASNYSGHKNLLLRIRDFGTIVEANRAMKDGDYGRLMFMWQRWAVMSQGIGGMPHYSKHLPKLIILIKYILPKSLSDLVMNTLLMSPTGKPGHFVATDFYLEELAQILRG